MRTHTESLAPRSGAAVFVASVLTVLACSSPEVLSRWDDAELVAEFERLHRPVADVYRVPPERPRELWELLEKSFAGDALTAEYVEHFATAWGMARDATSIRIASLDYESVEVVERSSGRVRVQADWSVGGLVTHRAHTHPRINRYLATFDLAPAAGDPAELRIVATQIRDLERRGRLLAGGGAERPDSARGSLSLGDLLRAGVLEQVEQMEAQEEPPEP